MNVTQIIPYLMKKNAMGGARRKRLWDDFEKR